MFTIIKEIADNINEIGGALLTVLNLTITIKEICKTIKELIKRE
jgi:hypothetical protein